MTQKEYELLIEQRNGALITAEDLMERSYKDFPKIYIGESDYASLILAGCSDTCEDGLLVKHLSFRADGAYSAYLVEGEAEIGSHYEEVCRFDTWMKIYDDTCLVREIEGREIVIYRAGMMGCIIQVK